MTQPNREPEAAEYRENLLRYPHERPNVDYKAAVAFRKRDAFGAKLIKHILALANGGGGTLVIGFREDDHKQPVPDEAMSPEIASTYDPTVLTPAVNEAVRGTTGVTLQIHKHPYEGVTYPIITVEPFQDIPYFCAVERRDEDGKMLLKQGALYIRSGDSATVELATPEDWLRLLDVAVTRRQDDLLARFGALMRQLGVMPPEAQGPAAEQLKREFQQWVDAQTAQAYGLAAEGNRTLPGSYRFAYGPLEPVSPRIDAELRRAMQEARRPNTGWPIGLMPQGFRNPHDRTEAVDDGVRTVIGQHDTSHFDYWLLARTGNFFLLRNLQEDVDYGTPGFRAGSFLRTSTVVWRVAEAVDHCVALYRALGVGGEAQVFFEVEYGGLNGRTLFDDQHILFHGGAATRDTVRFVRLVSLDQLVADADSIVQDAVREVLSVFGFFEVPPTYVGRQLLEYRSSNVGG